MSSEASVLIPELCQLFYSLGWVTGTGGGVSIKDSSGVFIAPSGVQKERIQSHHLFILDPETYVELHKPSPHLNLKQSQCTPLFLLPYKYRNAGAVIHTHSQNAVLVTMLYEKFFEIRNQEMIKGIEIGATGNNLTFSSLLQVPIIENTDHEEDLEKGMYEAMLENPNTNAILVKRHGIYV